MYTYVRPAVVISGSLSLFFSAVENSLDVSRSYFLSRSSQKSLALCHIFTGWVLHLVVNGCTSDE